MRVDLFGSTATTEAVQQASKIGTEKAANATNQSKTQAKATEDTTTLSSGSDSVSSLTQAALQTFPTRAQKVETLKLAVNSAQYKLDSAKIAEALSNSDI